VTSFAAESKTGLVPLFPLPEACLLPGELMPLYVFEPRYRDLLAAAVAGEQLVAVARFQPGWEEAYYLNPPVYPCMGVGRIAAHRRRPDGTSDIVLRGIARVRLLVVVKDLPFRLARVDDLPEVVPDAARLEGLAREIAASLEGLGANELLGALEGERCASELPGRLACLLQYDADARQRILEADDVAERLQVVLGLLRCCEERRRRERLVERLQPKNRNLN
jgi:Lon protease-like protein